MLVVSTNLSSSPASRAIAVDYGTILQVYFSVAHDPTQLNPQSPDWGTQFYQPKPRLVSDAELVN